MGKGGEGKGSAADAICIFSLLPNYRESAGILLFMSYSMQSF